MPGTRTSTDTPRAEQLTVTSDHVRATLTDGRAIRVPLSYYPTLERATPAQRRNRRRIGKGIGYHWEDLDFDLSIEGMLRGERERTGSQRTKRAARK